MALTSLTDIKNWFKTNLIPTQQQFYDMFDSFRHKNDKVAATDIDGLATLLAAKASNEEFISHTGAENAHAGLFGALRTWVGEQILGATVESTLLGSITPSSTIPATINVHGFAAAAGTYANCGGMVVPVNSIAFLSRVGGAWTVSATTFSLAEYAKNVDFTKINFDSKKLLIESGRTYTTLDNKAIDSINRIKLLPNDTLKGTDLRVTVIRKPANYDIRIYQYISGVPSTTVRWWIAIPSTLGNKFVYYLKNTTVSDAFYGSELILDFDWDKLNEQYISEGTNGGISIKESLANDKEFDLYRNDIIILNKNIVKEKLFNLKFENIEPFLVSELNIKAASAILDLKVYLRDDLVDASNVRVTRISNLTSDNTALVIKDFGSNITLTYVNTGSKNEIKTINLISGSGEFKVIGTLDLTKIPTNFSFVETVDTLCLKVKATSFLKLNQDTENYDLLLSNDFGIMNYNSLDYRMKQAISKIKAIEIWVDTSLLNDDIRIISLTNVSTNNYHFVVKNYTKNTTFTMPRLTVIPTVPTSFDFSSSDGKIRVFGVLDFSKLLSTDNFYVDNINTSINIRLREQNTFVKPHFVDYNNPHQVTKTQIGLGNVDNTPDLTKPLSNAAVAANNTLVNQINAISTGLVYKTPVATFTALASTYPTPSNGWAVMVIDEGFVYSYNGTAWANTGIKQQQALSPIITIASVDASADVKNRCHYICDGVDDDVQINAAIQSISTRGGKIQLSGGRFYIANTIVIDKAITLIGEGTGLAGRNTGNLYGDLEGITTLRASSDIDVMKIDSTIKLRGIKFSDFLLQGFGKDISTKIGIYCKTTTDVLLIHNVNVTDCGIGLFANNPDACNISHSSFQWNALGALINGGIYPNITNCVFADNNGVETVVVNGTTYVVKTGGFAIKAFHSNISSNTFVRNDKAGIPYNSMSVLSGVACKITNNAINEQNGNGIGIIGDASGYAENTMISNNNIIDFGKSLNSGNRVGIYILKGNKNHIFGNYIGSALGGSTAEYAVYEDRISTGYTGVSVVKNNIFYWVQNAGKVALSGSLSAATNNVNVDS